MSRILAALATCAALLATAAPLRAADTGVTARGEYLARAADCVACHTAEGHAPWTGGRAFKLPFGTLYSPNITPDRETGIGNYTDDEFVSALRRGVGHGGKHLYPAMPYNSYTKMTRDDVLAIKAYLFSLPAVHATAPANSLRFPFNQRWGMIFWNWFNNPNRRLAPDPAHSEQWNRGAYLVQALEHCDQCHTPRNFMQGIGSHEFAGATQQGWLAYNITSDKTHGIGAWSDDDLAAYLATGQAPGHGPASGPMAEAVTNSLRYLTAEDIRAMVVYLRDIPARSDGPPVVSPGATARAPDPLGGRIFAEACAGCHLPGGTGRQSPWAALGGSHSTADPDGTNIVQILRDGSVIGTAQGPMFMHGFTAAYTAPELAALANQVIGQFGHVQGHVTAKAFEAKP